MLSDRPAPVREGFMGRARSIFGPDDYSLEKLQMNHELADREPRYQTIGEVYMCLNDSCWFGREIEWRKTTAPARVVFPFYEPQF